MPMRNRALLFILVLTSACLFVLRLLDDGSAGAELALVERPLESTLHIPFTPEHQHRSSSDNSFFGSVCELPEFRPESKRVNFTIVVFAWRRLASLQRLLKSLKEAEYCGDQVPMRISVDGGATPIVVQMVREFHWPHGPKEVTLFDEEGRSLGIRGMWTDTTHRPGDEGNVLPLEDDMQLSPLYYWWLQRANRAYGDLDDEQHVRRQRIVGISLYTPRLNEIRYPQKKWLPEHHTRAAAFRLQVPCSWGALYIGSVWREFLHFYRLRVKPPFFNFSQEATQRGVGKEREPLGDPHVRLPNSRSNVWPRSWKRFMIDFMYGRGLVMLYPNLPDQRSFSTTYMERGSHSGKDGKIEELQVNGVRKDIDPLKTVPLVRPGEAHASVQLLSSLPPLSELPVFNLQHEPRSLESLAQQGFAFTEHVRWWGVELAKRRSMPVLKVLYAELADAWSGMEPPLPRGGCVPDQLMMSPPAPSTAQPWAQPEVQGAEMSSPQAASARAAQDGTAYLVYQPPSGLGEWFISLRNAAALARVLQRTLVIPHLMWDGDVNALVPYSSIFDINALLQVLPSAIEMDNFLKLGLEPAHIILVHVKDPGLVPSRLYFDTVTSWRNVSMTHIAAQMCMSVDITRLYGGCSERVLAFSHLYAAFEGFTDADGTDDPEMNHWYTEIVPNAVSANKPSINTMVTSITRRLRAANDGFTCVHLTDLDSAVINSRSPLTAGSDVSSLDAAIDVAQPAARSVPFPARSASDVPNTLRQPGTTCDGYEAEARHFTGRNWVKELTTKGVACHVTEGVIAATLSRLPPKNSVFVLSDGQRTLPDDLMERASAALNTGFVHIGDVVALLGLSIRAAELPSLEQAVCSNADMLVLNAFSPLSAFIRRRARSEARIANRRPPPELFWMRIDTDACMPLFTRTARFDIQPNRFGILGQFGPARKLQLSTTNVSSLIGWDGKVIPNASLEIEVYMSNASHTLHIFEYTKENNLKGFQLKVPPPPEGWRMHVWHSLVLPISDSAYSFPMSTPWDDMDRLELYYANPHSSQLPGDYIRIRNVFLRSTRSYSSRGAAAEPQVRPCREMATLSTQRRSPLQSTQRRQRLGGENLHADLPLKANVEDAEEQDVLATEDNDDRAGILWWKLLLGIFAVGVCCVGAVRSSRFTSLNRDSFHSFAADLRNTLSG